MRLIVQYSLAVLLFIIITPIHANEYQGIVIKVVDGDTLDVKLDDGVIKRVRLRYIDAPEAKQSFGKESTKFLKDNTLGKTIIVDVEKKGRHGRDIGDIFIYDDNVAIYINAKLIKSGNAWVYTKYRKNDYLMNLENYAKKHRLGLWKDDYPLEPWKHRKKNLNR